MVAAWKEFEKSVRRLAAYIWDRDAEPSNIGGVDVDCVLHLNQSQCVLIEITEEKKLEKVRKDILKLEAARTALWSKDKIAAQCFCVINGAVTVSMKKTADDLKVSVRSIDQFSRLFFDFESYKIGRLRRQFGSSVHPVTGVPDNSKYVAVSYIIQGREGTVSVKDIVELVHAGKKIILLGEYGSGKSRCLKETFLQCSELAHSEGIYPLSIDLRETWGLRRAAEIVRRHFDELGLDRGSSSVIKAFGTSTFLYLLDGFDEVGSQAWSDDEIKLRNIRKQALSGVRDIIAKSTGGLIVCGRDHYFNSDEEMFEALGIDRAQAVVLRSKTEFSEEEMEEFLAEKSEDLVLPEWLPRRPLICQIIGTLSEDHLRRMFHNSGGDVEFWRHFIGILCQRDAEINTIFEPEALQAVLVRLARFTRAKSANVGPLSLNEIQRAFEEVVGGAPVDQAAMLQRLPGLGRVEAESNDRRFIDVYILDGLRALDVDFCVSNQIQNLAEMAWSNPLAELGQRLLADIIEREIGTKKFLAAAVRCASSKNRTAAGDVVASMLRMNASAVEFGGLAVDDCYFLTVDFSYVTAVNLQLSNCIFGSVVVSRDIQDRNLVVSNSLATRVYGIARKEGLPPWLSTLSVDHFESLETVAHIRKVKLLPSHQILATIIRKTFFQKGTGRKEEALLRGLGAIGSSGTANRIINLLISEGMLTKFKGDEGNVYSPVRRHADRMIKMLAALNLSSDPIWVRCASL